MVTDGRIKADKPMLRFIRDISDRNILDVGCSDCFLADRLKVDKKKYRGLDYDGISINKAKRKGYNVKKYDLSSGKIPFKNGYFDVVIAKDILEHLHDVTKIAKEINRVLKPNGIAFISVPSEWSHLLWDDYTHYRGFTSGAIKELFIDNGFKIMRFEKYKNLITFKNSRLKYTGRVLLKKLTGLDFITQGYMVEILKLKSI